MQINGMSCLLSQENLPLAFTQSCSLACPIYWKLQQPRQCPFLKEHSLFPWYLFIICSFALYILLNSYHYTSFCLPCAHAIFSGIDSSFFLGNTCISFHLNPLPLAKLPRGWLVPLSPSFSTDLERLDNASSSLWLCSLAAPIHSTPQQARQSPLYQVHVEIFNLFLSLPQVVYTNHWFSGEQC